MKFGTRHLLYLLTLIAAHFAFRGWWVSIGIPAYGGLIPATLGAAVALYLGWTRSLSVLLAGAAAGATAMVSGAAIAAEVVLGSNAMSFLTTNVSDARDNTNLMLNLVAVFSIAICSFFFGAALGHASGRVRSSFRSQSLPHFTPVAVAVMCLLTLFAWHVSRPRVSDTKGKKIVHGMQREQVEATLGSPNLIPSDDFPDAYWDAYTHFGRRYVSVSVKYDRNGRVKRVKTNGYWRTRRWLYW